MDESRLVIANVKTSARAAAVSERLSRRGGEAPLRHEQAREQHESGNAELHHHQQDLIVRILRGGRAGAVEAIRIGLAEAAGADTQHRARRG